MSKPIVPSTDHLKRWLNSAGLYFDSFYPLEASADAHLFAYLVGHEAFEVAWGEWPSFIFAPAGGGKTALRSRVTQACWATQETNRPFPIVYSPPFLKWGNLTPSLDDHLSALSEAGGLYLLLILAHRPHWFMRLSQEERETVRDALNWSLPGPLESYMLPCKEVNDLYPYCERFPPASLPSDPASAEALSDFFNALQKISSDVVSRRPSASIRWASLLHVITNVFQIPSVYILLDGLDSTNSTAENPIIAVQLIASLLYESPRWAYQRVYFKAFIPVETRFPLEVEYSNVMNQAQSNELVWTPELLAEVVRRRVYVASRGEFGSLSAVAVPSLQQDFELKLAREVYPLPREMLAITHRVLDESAGRSDSRPLITERDYRAALEWYRSTVVFAQEKLTIGGNHV